MLINHKIFIVWLLGSISGFTIMISGNSLNYWLAKEQVDIRTISMFAFVLLPYSINFIWAPIFDTKKIKFLSKLFGNRLAWIFIIQILLAITIFSLSLIPLSKLVLFALIAFTVSFLSSTQDGLLGALKTEIITKKEQGAFAGVYIFGYRIGMLISGSLAVYLSNFLSFTLIYKIFAGIVLLQSAILILLVINSRAVILSIKHESIIMMQPLNFIARILKPVGSVIFIILTIIFLILYRLPDNFINIMINPFLIELGFNTTEIASTGKFFGVIGAIFGGFIASYIMRKKSVIDSLLLFGILHAFAHSLFIVQEYYGKNLYLLFVVISFESITGGMSMAAYLAFIASLCQGKFRATQYSFFSAMMGLSRAIFPTISGYIVVLFGWNIFFSLVTLATIPSLILAPLLKKYTKKNDLET